MGTESEIQNSTGSQLRTIGLFIGWFNLVCSVCMVIVCLYQLFFIREVLETTLASKAEQDELYFWGLLLAIIAIIIFVFFIVPSGLLVLGIYKKNTKLMGPWLVMTTVFIFILWIGVLFQAIQAVQVNQASSTGSFLWLLSDLLGLVLLYTKRCAIRDLHIEMKNGSQAQLI